MYCMEFCLVQQHPTTSDDPLLLFLPLGALAVFELLPCEADVVYFIWTFFPEGNF